MVEIDYATLTLNDSGLMALNNRINTTAPVTLRGAALTLTGRPVTGSLDTLGLVTVDQGLTTITVNASSGTTAGIFGADLVAGTLAQTAANGATVNFIGQTNGVYTALGQMGSNPRFGVTTAPTMINNIIPWAVVGGSETASYVAYGSGVSGGIAALNAPGYAGYDASVLPATASNATQNIRLVATGTVISGGQTINSLNIVGTFNLNFSNSGDPLNLNAGVLLHSGGAGTSAPRSTAAS